MRAVGEELWAAGARLRFVGANRYDLASSPPSVGGYVCGRGYEDAELARLLDELVASTGARVVRTWAFARFTDGGRDFSTLDRLIAAARARGLRLVLTLENEWRDCTDGDPATSDGRKGPTWFAGGWQGAYREHLSRVVARYRDEPAVAMWQLMNEAECPDADALLAFARNASALVKSLDPNHLVSLGTIGTGQAGTDNARFERLHALDGIDVVEAHDYAQPPTYAEAAEPIPGTTAGAPRANSVASALAAAHAVGKPFFIGEAGLTAPRPPHAFTVEERAAALDAKIAAHQAVGTDGFLVWSFYDLAPGDPQGWDFDGADPLAAVLRRRAAE